jgi:hypothetical protein
LIHAQVRLPAVFDALVELTARGDPQSLLRWTCKGVRRLAAELQSQGFRVGRRKVADLRDNLEFRLQANRNTCEGNQHPGRHAQFQHIG